MATGGPLPFLNVSGSEVANAARTLSYLRRGLGDTENGHWELGDGDVCGVLYRQDGGTVVAPTVYLSPAADPAPWYDPTEPGSTSFLGLVLLDIQGYDSTIVRSVTQRMGGLGGGTLSAQYRKPRVWKFRAAMVSANDAGAEYGLRWLTSVLEAKECDQCEDISIDVRLTCPASDGSDDAQGLWTSYQAALTDGPHEVEKYAPGAYPDVLAGCRDYVTVEFTVTAGNPWLYKPPVVCLETTDLADCSYGSCTDICDFLAGASSAPCCTVEPPQRGVLGAIFTLENPTSTPFAEVQFESRTNCGDIVPLLALKLSAIPAFSTVIVDCSQHTVTVIDSAGEILDGQYLIEIPSGKTIEWIEVADCEPAACLCVNALGGTPGHTIFVTIETQLREA